MKRRYTSPRRWLVPALSALGLLAGSCGGSDQTVEGRVDGTTSEGTGRQATTTEAPTDVDLPELAAARATWAELGLQNYIYTFTRSCECPDDQRGPFRVVVENGEVDRVEWLGREVDQPARTVPEFYAAIEETFGGGAEVSATFDQLTGHPVEVRLDLEALAVDGGEVITITSFASTELLRADLESARAQWSDAGIMDYELTYRVQCFCPETIRRVTVVGGEVVNVVDEGERFDGWPGFTVETLFETLEEAVTAPAFSIDVSYDEGYGFPSSYHIDPEQNLVDEEHGIVVIDFKPRS